MSEFKDNDEVWFFHFIDHDNVSPLEASDLMLCSEQYKHIDTYSRQNAILAKSKNEAIDAMIKCLEDMKE